MLVPTTCFNCESACGLLAYVDKETLEVRKFEGNPEHPGSRGRNCAKGPATLNQVNDPDRILYPLEARRQPRRGPLGARLLGRGARRHRRPHPARDRRRSAATRSCITSAGPARTASRSGSCAAWGVDGHNSHTNICSCGARAGYHYWMGLDRPSPDHANAKVILLISAHLESGHYFNPHAQRVIDGKANGAKLIVFDTRLSNTATHADYWIAPVAGLGSGDPARDRQPPDPRTALRPRFRAALVELAGVSRARAARAGAGTSSASRRRSRSSTPSYTFEFAARESGVPAATLAEIADGGRLRRDPPLDP